MYHWQKKREVNEPVLPVSVIICTRNDLQNLQQNLSSVLEQDYPSFEVIVVNDASNDGTKEYLENLSYPHLRSIHLDEKTRAGKKPALITGTDNALYPFLLLTDADCKPATKNWIRSHIQFAFEKSTVVLGYGKHQKQKGFLNRLIRFDTAIIAMQYMNSAMWKHPYMAVGRNMGYSKDLSPVLKKIDANIASGDDDLFIQAISKKANFKVNLEKESFTTSITKSTIKEWLSQKARHTTTAPNYGFFTKFTLLLKWVISAGFYLGFIIILLTGNVASGSILFTLNLLLLAMFNGLWFRKLGENDLILWGPFLDFIYTFVQPVFVIKSWGRKKDEWN
jgi:biofilm PGA synthesis N-glycosyltransferase PgaC